VVVEHVYDAVVERVVGAARQLAIGHPAVMGTQLGPLIDGEAHERVLRYVRLASEEGEVVLAGVPVPDQGWFVPPVIAAGLDRRTSRVARDEVFGPLLSVFRAADFEDALHIAGDTDFALTAGLFSRSPAHIRQAGADLRAGNVYINRSTTGAVVGRQPFGGYGMSGVGSKAGGPDYLLQFLDPRVVSENTLRQGFAPLDD
jgi:RHH-type proline utilization regulon transcriptional repressor/proline dehydrogenase/delta 1-pyrroline-5-carboxylate dehydrogenase